MNHREDLLRGAKQCIADKGYARTTARDIATASGANLASIGYHFGSKDALLNAAVIALFDEWGDAIEEATRKTAEAPPLTRLEHFLENFIGGIPPQRRLVSPVLQALSEAEYSEEIRSQISESYGGAPRKLAAMVLGVPAEEITDDDLPLGALVLSLVNGYTIQWYISPDTPPSAAQLAAAIRGLARTSSRE